MEEEYKRFRIEESARYLERIKAMAIRLTGLNATLEQQMDLAQGLKGIDYSKDRVSSVSSGDQMPSTIHRIEEIIAERQTIADGFQEELDRAAAAVDAMESAECAAAIEMHYLGNLPWSFVADRLQYSKPGMMHLRERALCEFYELIPEGHATLVPYAI